MKPPRKVTLRGYPRVDANHQTMFPRRALGGGDCHRRSRDVAASVGIADPRRGHFRTLVWQGEGQGEIWGKLNLSHENLAQTGRRSPSFPSGLTTVDTIDTVDTVDMIGTVHTIAMIER